MLKGKTLLISFFLIFSCICNAQTSGQVPLNEILNNITKQHGIQFNRIDQEIDIYRIIPPESKLKPEEKIEYIEQRTRLQFTAINNKLYSIHSSININNPLCGYLIDPVTLEGINGAQIKADNTVVAISDATGYFKLLLEKPVHITISHISYNEKIINALELFVPDCPEIYISEKVTELNEIKTVRYLAKGISKKDNGELIIKPRQFGILPGLTEPDVQQTMLELPGIVSSNETVSNINVRGGTNDQNLFLWNGIRLFQTSHFFGLISAFNPLQASKISIYKNGTPAFYGESVSSLIDISTLPKNDTAATIAADMISVNAVSTVKFSDNDLFQITARRSLPWKTATFNSYRNRIYQNTVITDITENEQKNMTVNEDFYFYDLSFSFLHKINNKHTLQANGIGIENSLNVYQKMPSGQRNSTLKQNTFGTSISFSSQWNNNSTSEIVACLSSYKLDGMNEAVENSQTNFQNNNILDKGLMLKYNYSIHPTLTLSAGYQLNEISITNSDGLYEPYYYKSEKEVSVSQAGIVTGSYTSANNKTKLGIGTRTNYFTKYKTLFFEPRITFSHKLASGLRLEILGERKSQTISQIIDRQQDFLGIEKRRWVLSNDDSIPIEKSIQCSIGLNYIKNNWLATIDGYYKKVNGISSDSQGFQNQFEFITSTGSYTTSGLEVLLQKKITIFSAWLSYSYSNSNYFFNGYIPPEFTNNFRILHAISGAVTYESQGFKVAIGTKWRTGTPFTQVISYIYDPYNPANSQIIYSFPNNSELSNSFVVNLSACKTWKLKKETEISIACSILNFLNRKNTLSRYYRINKTTNTAEEINTYGLTRTPNIEVKICF